MSNNKELKFDTVSYDKELFDKLTGVFYKNITDKKTAGEMVEAIREDLDRISDNYDSTNADKWLNESMSVGHPDGTSTTYTWREYINKETQERMSRAYDDFMKFVDSLPENEKEPAILSKNFKPMKWDDNSPDFDELKTGFENLIEHGTPVKENYLYLQDNSTEQ